jgi:hypothetical protein
VRVRIYLADGSPSWRDEGPSRVRLPGWSGQMIVSAPSSNAIERERERARERQKAYMTRKKAEG